MLSRKSEKAKRRELIAAALAAGRTKAVYIDQADARLGLTKLLAAKPESPPTRVYPCDTRRAWHITSKHVGRKKFPWDKNPDWERPVAKPPPGSSDGR